VFNRGAFLTIDDQDKLFDGCVLVSPRRIELPTGSIVGCGQFNVIYGGYNFYLDTYGEKITRKAFKAYRDNVAINKL
jgi:hypothetical protein